MREICKSSRVWIAGHTGLVGSALVRALLARGYGNLVLRTHKELDLLDQRAVQDFVKTQQVDCAIVAAAKVGGIVYNQHFQADFLFENLSIACNVIHAAAQHGIEKLIYLGSSCIYPKLAPQPIQEASLLTGYLEPSNEGYAIAKIAGLKLCEKYMSQYGKRFISAMPTNLYGPNDNFHPDHSHVVPGMLRRFHHAKMKNESEVVIWGTGAPRREFLFVDDFAEALLCLMDNYEGPGPINVGTGEDLQIIELAKMVATTVGFEGKIVCDTTKPDGTPRKVLDVSKIRALGWAPKTSLEVGLQSAYRWAVETGSIEAVATSR